ncbi:MAG: mobile mystery protein A [Gammaproteobacteria bacterium]|nr:mobile mystery protein A [Gammaproteobacteria bacterium]
MRPEDRATARRQLDKRLSSLQNAELFVRPPRGWLKAIREALGMTTTQLGQRLGVSQSRVVAIQQAESKGTITLNSLEKAAQALDCHLVYALVPRQPLEEMVKKRATLLARKRLKSASHTMALEAQGVEAADENEQLKRLIRQLIGKPGSKLWEKDA